MSIIAVLCLQTAHKNGVAVVLDYAPARDVVRHGNEAVPSPRQVLCDIYGASGFRCGAQAPTGDLA